MLIMFGILVILLGILGILLQSFSQSIPVVEQNVYASTSVPECTVSLTIPLSPCNGVCQDSTDCVNGLSCYKQTKADVGVCRSPRALTNTSCPSSPTPTCIPRPACLDTEPSCEIAPPQNGNFCPPTTLMPTPTCIPRPTCLDSNPACLIAEPVEGWCTEKPSITTPEPTPTGIIPNPPRWFNLIPSNMRGFLEQLYLTVFVFGRQTNLRHLLEGI